MCCCGGLIHGTGFVFEFLWGIIFDCGRKYVMEWNDCFGFWFFCSLSWMPRHVDSFLFRFGIRILQELITMRILEAVDLASCIRFGSYFRRS